MSGPIGFVGLGIMGKGMARNLLAKLPGDYVVWNRSAAASAELAAAFPGKVTVAATAGEVVSKCKLTFSMLSTMEASEAVFDGDSGLIQSVTVGKTLVDCATLSPERMQKISDGIKAQGGCFLEAPVSGSKVPAETGTLIFLCGGDESVFNNSDVKAGLDAMGKASFYLGPVGAGSRMKLVVNGLMGTMLNAFTESLVLCKESGLPQDTLLQVLDLGAMANPMFKGKGVNIINDKYDANFPLKHAAKDVRLALALADQVGITMPVMEASHKQYGSVLDTLGDEDFSAIMKVDLTKKE